MLLSSHYNIAYTSPTSHKRNSFKLTWEQLRVNDESSIHTLRSRQSIWKYWTVTIHRSFLLLLANCFKARLYYADAYMASGYAKRSIETCMRIELSLEWTTLPRLLPSLCSVRYPKRNGKTAEYPLSESMLNTFIPKYVPCTVRKVDSRINKKPCVKYCDVMLLATGQRFWSASYSFRFNHTVACSRHGCLGITCAGHPLRKRKMWWSTNYIYHLDALLLRCSLDRTFNWGALRIVVNLL